MSAGFPNPFEQQKWAKQQVAHMDETFGVGPWGKSRLPQAQPFRDALTLETQDPQAYNRLQAQTAMGVVPTPGQQLQQQGLIGGQGGQGGQGGGGFSGGGGGGGGAYDPYRMLTASSPSSRSGGTPSFKSKPINFNKPRVNPFM